MWRTRTYRRVGAKARRREGASLLRLRASAPTRLRASEDGFTLAGVLVILTVIMVFVAYTVPRQWSEVMNRERDKQTIFVMRQYARAIREWTKRHGGSPVS